ncbi:hypothetical protein KC345_g209 [Hortaea werneckii]|nr:hypothetical protein KC345_g209 [Hortaea werneckii]
MSLRLPISKPCMIWNDVDFRWRFVASKQARPQAALPVAGSSSFLPSSTFARSSSVFNSTQMKFMPLTGLTTSTDTGALPLDSSDG